jgi:AcrR family transcriptional regulator
VARQTPPDEARRSNGRRGTLNEKRWEEILRAAAEEFHENGYKAARLQDIGRRVGLLTGSLYYYIDSKEDLLFALVESAHRKGLEIVTEDRDSAQSDAPARLRAFIERHVALQFETTSDAVAVVGRDRSYLSPEHRKQVDGMRRELHRFVLGIIEQGIAEGSFRPDVDPVTVTSTVFATLNSTRDWLRDQDLATVTSWYVDLFLRGLGTAPAASTIRPAVAGAATP